MVLGKGCAVQMQQATIKPYHHMFEVSNKYILLDVLLCSIAEYFYELCCIFGRARRASQIQQRVKILSDTTQQNV